MPVQHNWGLMVLLCSIIVGQQLHRVPLICGKYTVFLDESYSKTLFRGEEARRHGVMFEELQQHILQPVPHS